LSDVTAFSFSFDFERSTLNTPCWDAPGRIAVRDHNPAGVTKQANDRAEIVSQRFALAFQRFSFRSLVPITTTSRFELRFKKTNVAVMRQNLRPELQIGPPFQRSISSVPA